MNTPTENASLSSLLASVAMVGEVEARCLGLSRTDKSASAEAEIAHGAKQGIAKVNVSRLAGSETRVKEIRTCQTEGRNLMNRFTTAWGERRLMPNVNLQDFLVEWTRIKGEHDRLAARFLVDAPELIASAQENLGKFDIEVPTIEEIEGAFALGFKLEPVPDASKFRNTTLDAQMENNLRQRFEANVQASYQLAQRDAFGRLAKPLRAMVERMAAYEEREADKKKGLSVGKEGYFRDSLCQNIDAIADVFESFNLTGDPVMDAISTRLQQLKGLEAEDLRKSPELRKHTASSAASILEEIKASGWI